MNIFDRNSIGNITLRNSIIRSGTWMRLATEEGFLTDELVEKYGELATGNLGMVIAGYARVLDDERANNCQIGLYDDKFIPQLREFTNMFHQNGTAIGIQLAMGGTQVHYKGDITWKLYSPSATSVNHINSKGEEVNYKVEMMTSAEIDMVIEKFAEAAVRAKDSGFDLVQIHAGHGYFVSQWMNPKINTRTDEYGEDKSLFITKLYKKMREAVGVDFAIGIKLNSEEQVADSSNHDEMLKLCKQLDELGIDLIEVSGCNPSRSRIKSISDESYFLEFTSKLKSCTNCRIMMTGGNRSFDNFTKLRDEVGFDFIGLSRPLISEPDLVQKWQQDNSYKPRCVSCNHCHRDVYVCVFDK